MSRNRVNAVVDIFMFVFFVVCAYSGYVLQFLLVGGMGYRDGRGCAELFQHMGITRYYWVNIHIWTGWIFFTLIILHLVLHLGWIKRIPSFFRRREKA